MKKSILGILGAALTAFSAHAVDVSTADGLRAAIGEGHPITLTEDLDLSEWTTVDCPSGVSLDGRGHVITGLTVPLLGAVTGDATIRDIVFRGAAVSATAGDIAVCATSLKAGSIEVSGLSFVGCTLYKKNSGAAGFVTASLETPTTALVENCTFDADCKLTVAAGATAAPVAGYFTANGDGAEATVSKCIYRGQIVLNDWTMKTAGIVCGVTAKQTKYTHMAYVNIYDCVNYAGIIHTGQNCNGGGIVNTTECGTASTDGAIRIARCVNYGNINFKAAQYPIGGIVSLHKNGALEITDCVNFGNLTAQNGQSVGGIVGSLRTLINTSATITGCANLGDLAGNDAGGIIGEHTRQNNSKDLILRACLNRGSLTARRDGSAPGELVGYIATASAFPKIELSGSVCRTDRLIGGMISGATITEEVVADNVIVTVSEGLVDGTDLAALNACQGGCNLWKQGTLTPILKIMPDEPAPDVMTIVFKDSTDFAETVLKTCVITRGTTPVPPPAPEHDGYTFLGWSLDELSGLDADTTITAVYQSGTIEHTVRFLDWNGELIGEPQQVAHGKAAEAPTDPVREGWFFTGWNTAFDEVTEDLDVTATYVLLVQDFDSGEALAAALTQEIHPSVTCRLTDDIVLPSDWSEIDFAATLDGCGHTISYAGKRPLFRKLSGAARNFVLDGRVVTVTDETTGEAESRPTTIGNINERFGLVAVNCLGGTVEDVMIRNYILQMKNDVSGLVCGFVCATAGDGAMLRGCTVEESCRFDTRATAIGGIVGASAMSDTWTGADPQLLTLASCTNRADIVTFSSGAANLAGVLAECNSASAERQPDIIVTNCVNYGSLRKGNVNIDGHFGGIVANRYLNLGNGIRAGTLTIVDCANHGDIDVQGTGFRTDMNVQATFYGGILGYTYRLGAVTIVRCRNNGRIGDLVSPTGAALNGGFAGGLVGYASDVYSARPVVLVDSANYGAVNGGRGAGGLIGGASFNSDYSGLEMTARNCANYGALAVGMDGGFKGEWIGDFGGVSKNPTRVTFGAWNCFFSTSAFAGVLGDEEMVHRENCVFADAEGFSAGAAWKSLTAWAEENGLTPWIRTRLGVELSLFGIPYNPATIISIR